MAKKTQNLRLPRAVILPVVLIMIGLLALTMAGFVFFVRSTVSGIQAESDAQQARLAAESGFEEIVAILREFRHDPSVWYDQPQRFRHQLVFADGFTRQSDPLRETSSRKQYLEEKGGANAWRWAACAARLDGPDGVIRFGITPESAKLNLNAASEKQIRELLTPVLADLGVENTAEIIDAILDWRDPDSTPRENGAENTYYNTLTPPYNAKNNRFDTIGELLLVKGMSASLLWGEDANRNGILDRNEDDGDASFPFDDNADGHLNYGIAEYVTVFARDVETALDNKQRINLNSGAMVAAQIAKQFENNELSDATIAFLAGLQQRGIQVSMLKSPAWLLAPGPEETPESLFTDPDQDAAATQPVGESGDTGGALGGGEQKEGQKEDGEGEGGKITDRKKAQEDGQETKDDGDQDVKAGKGDTGGKDPSAGTGGKGPQPSGQPGGRPVGGRGGRGGRGGQPQATPQTVFAALQASPITLDELPYIMDRFTTRNPQEASQPNERLININTASARVLAVIPGISAEAVGAILAMRAEQPYEVLKTTAWPLTTGALDAATYKRIAPYITAKSYQFHVEVIGYADHCKSMKRLEWVIEMIGPMAQVKYHRDLTELGIGFPIDQEQTVQTSAGN